MIAAQPPDYGSMLDPLMDSMVELLTNNMPLILGITAAYMVLKRVDQWMRDMAKQRAKEKRAADRIALRM